VRHFEDRLNDILQAVNDGAELVKRGHSAFVADPLLIRAAKNIIAEIGEAAKDLDDELLATMPGVPWKNVKGMRDKVVHDYPEVDLDVMWDTLLHGLPAVGTAIINRAKPSSD
jgi:uncharacterized protein with HEPN domain